MEMILLRKLFPFKSVSKVRDLIMKSIRFPKDELILAAMHIPLTKSTCKIWCNRSSVLKELMVVCFKVLEDDKQWWKLRNRSGQAGYVPYNILDVVKLEDPQTMIDPPYSPAIPYSPVNTFTQ